MSKDIKYTVDVRKEVSVYADSIEDAKEKALLAFAEHIDQTPDLTAHDFETTVTGMMKMKKEEDK